MIERNLPILIWILDASDSALKHIQPVTRLDIMDGATLNPHPDGLFSTEIFGPFGNELRDKMFGKIDLKVDIMHPKLYRDVMSLKGQYKRIIDGSLYARWDDKLKDFITVEEDDLDGKTGYGFFMSHVKDIKFEKNKSITRNETIDGVTKWNSRFFMNNLVVIPAGLRDIEVSGDGRITKNEINDLYYRVLASASVIVKSNNMTGPEYDGIRRNIQNAVNDIYLYLEGMVGGKRGFMREKFISRRVMDGTRNVITAMDATGVHLDSPNVPGFDSTVLGLYQTSRSLAPKLIHWMIEGPVSKLRTVGDEQVPLVNKKTLKREYVNIDPDILDKYISEQGLMDLIARQADLDARHRPIEVGNYYLSLVYTDATTFKIFDSIDELPEVQAKLVKDGVARVDPITLEELIYYSMYDKIGEHFNISTRYPGTDDNSTYPTRIYVKTTTTASALYELDQNWELQLESDDITKDIKTLAPEWPMKGIHTYHDSHSPHSSRLGWSQADFDGDTMSSTSLMSSSATNELADYSKTRNAWITPDDQMRATIAYDTSVLIFKNLTGRFDHVRKLDKNNRNKLLSLPKG